MATVEAQPRWLVGSTPVVVPDQQPRWMAGSTLVETPVADSSPYRYRQGDEAMQEPTPEAGRSLPQTMDRDTASALSGRSPLGRWGVAPTAGTGPEWKTLPPIEPKRQPTQKLAGSTTPAPDEGLTPEALAYRQEMEFGKKVNDTVMEEAYKRSFYTAPAESGQRTAKDFDQTVWAAASRLGIEPTPEFASYVKQRLRSFDLVQSGQAAKGTPEEMRPYVLEAAHYHAKKLDERNKPGWGTRTLGLMAGGLSETGAALRRLDPWLTYDEAQFERQLTSAMTDPRRFVHPDQGFVSRNLMGAAGFLPKMGVAALTGGVPGVALGFGAETGVNIEDRIRAAGGNPAVAALGGALGLAAETALFSRMPENVIGRLGGEAAAKAAVSESIGKALSQGATRDILAQSLKKSGEHITSGYLKMATASLQKEVIADLGTRIGGGKGADAATVEKQLSDWVLSLPETAFQSALMHAPAAIASARRAVMPAVSRTVGRLMGVPDYIKNSAEARTKWAIDNADEVARNIERTRDAGVITPEKAEELLYGLRPFLTPKPERQPVSQGEPTNAEAVHRPEGEVREVQGGPDLRGPGEGQEVPEPTGEVAPARPEAEVGPPVQPGFVRLYHGGTGDYEPGEKRWLTQDLAYAEGYAAKSGGKVFYVDIPETSPLLVPASDVTGTNMKPWYVSFEAPAEISRQLRPISEPNGKELGPTEEPKAPTEQIQPPPAPPAAAEPSPFDAIIGLEEPQATQLPPPPSAEPIPQAPSGPVKLTADHLALAAKVEAKFRRSRMSGQADEVNSSLDWLARNKPELFAPGSEGQLRTAIRNRALTQFREANKGAVPTGKKEGGVEQVAAPAPTEPTETTEAVEAAKPFEKAAMDELRDTDPDLHKVLEAKISGKSLDDIAADIGMSHGTAAAWVKKGEAKLAEIIGRMQKAAAPEPTLAPIVEQQPAAATAPSPAPDEFLTLQALSNKANRKPYNPDLLTPERLAVLRDANLINRGTKNPKILPEGFAQLTKWEGQQREFDLAEGDRLDREQEAQIAAAEAKPTTEPEPPKPASEPTAAEPTDTRPLADILTPESVVEAAVRDASERGEVFIPPFTNWSKRESTTRALRDAGMEPVPGKLNYWRMVTESVPTESQAANQSLGKWEGIRTTPRPGTPEREAADRENTEADQQHTDATLALQKIKDEMERTGRGTKKYEQLKRKREKAEDAINKAWSRYEASREGWYNARLEDAAEQIDNPVLATAARYQLGLREAAKQHKAADYSQDHRDEAFRALQDGLRPLIGEALTSEKDGAGRLSPEKDAQVVEFAVVELAGNIMNNPLIAEDNLVDRMRGRVRGARLEEYRSQAYRTIQDITKSRENQQLPITRRGFRPDVRDVHGMYDFAQIDEAVEKAKQQRDQFDKDRENERFQQSSGITKAKDAIVAELTKRGKKGATSKQLESIVAATMLPDATIKTAWKELKDDGSVEIVEGKGGTKRAVLSETPQAKSHAEKAAEGAARALRGIKKLGEARGPASVSFIGLTKKQVDALGDVMVGAAQYGWHTFAQFVEAMKAKWGTKWNEEWLPGLQQMWDERHPKTEEPKAAAEPQKVTGVKKGIPIAEEIKTGTPIPETPAGEKTPPPKRGTPTRPLTEAGEPVVSLKHRVVTALREGRQRPELFPSDPESKQQWHDAALAKMEAEPQWLDRTLYQLRENPRQPDKIETAAMNIRYWTLNDRLETLANKIESATSPEQRAQLEAEYDKTEGHLNNLEMVAKASRAEWGRAGVSMQTELQNDFTIAGITTRVRDANNGAPLSPELRSKIATVAKDVAKAEEELAKANEKPRQEALDQAHAEAIKEAETPTPEPPKKSTGTKAKVKEKQAKVDAAWAEFGNLIRGKAYSTPLDPELLVSAGKIVKAYIELGVARFADFIAKAKERMGEEAEKMRPVFAQAWQQARAALPKSLKEFDPEDFDAIRREAKRIHRDVVELGTTDREQAVDAVHEELSTLVPGITRDQTMDAMSGYGDYKPLSKDAISVQVREHNQELQLVAKLRDVMNRIPMSKSGVERAKLSDEARRLQQQLNEAMKEYGVVVTDPETQLKSALDRAKTAVGNRIRDMETEIANREKIVRTRTELEPDAELLALREKRDALKKVWDEMFPKEPITEEKRIELAGRALDRAIDQLSADLQAGKIGRKAQAPRLSTPELEAKRATLEALKAQREELRANDPQYQADLDARRTATYERMLTKRLADLKARNAEMERTGEIPPKKERKTPETDLTLQKKYELKEQHDKARRLIEQIERKNRTLFQKTLGIIPEMLNTSRSIITSMDLSAVLRQGGFSFFSHPIMSVKAFPAMFRAFASHKGEFAATEELRTRPNARLYDQSGLAITTSEGKLSQMEELYMGRWSRLIPGVAGSERAYMTYLNRIRADVFDSMVNNLGKDGKVTPEEAKAIANFVNVSTGRGSLGPAAAAAVPMATVFFAPRFVLSRFQLLAGQPMWRGTARTRIAVAKEYARFLAGIAGMYGMAALYSFLNDDKQPTVETDPRSSDFGKVRFGDLRVDPLAGLSQATVLLSRIGSGSTKTLAGEVKPIVGDEVPYGGTTIPSELGRFLRTKLSPWLGTAIDLRTGKNVVGQEVTPGMVAAQTIVPLSFRDVYEAMQDEGVPRGTAFAMLALLGMGIQKFEPKTPKSSGGKSKGVKSKRVLLR